MIDNENVENSASVKFTQKVKSVQLSAVIIRADGTKEDLGEIAFWHQNPFMRGIWKAKKAIRRIKEKIF